MKTAYYFLILTIFGIFETYANTDLYHEEVAAAVNNDSEEAKSELKIKSNAIQQAQFEREIYDQLQNLAPKFHGQRSPMPYGHYPMMGPGLVQPNRFSPDVQSMYYQGYYPQHPLYYPSNQFLNKHEEPIVNNQNRRKTTETTTKVYNKEYSHDESNVIPPSSMIKADTGNPTNPLLKYCLKKRGQFPSPNACRKFINCWDDTAFEQNCAPGTLFNDKINVCDHKINVNCHNRPNDPVSSCEDSDSIYANPKNCSEFFKCANYKPIKYSCAKGLYFNPVTNICDFPRNVHCPIKTLEDIPEVSDPIAPVVPVVPEQPKRIPIGLTYTNVPCKTNLIYKMKPDCNAVSICTSEGFIQILNCPEGFGYDVNTERCLPDNIAKC